MEKMQKWKKILATVCFSSILMALLWCFQMALVDDIQSVNRVRFQEFYEEEEIDTLILGASPAIRGFNVHFMEEQGMENVFSMTTTNQIAMGGYYLLKEALKKHEIDTVIYHTSAVRYKSEDSVRPYNTQANYVILDDMRFSWNKLQYAYDALGEFGYVDLLSQYQRGKEKLSFSSMMETLETKLTNEDYKNYYAEKQLVVEVDRGNSVYAGKGYSYLTKSMEPGTAILRERDFVADSEQFEYLERTIELCQEKGIEFILMQVPSHPVEIYKNVPLYLEAEGRFQEIAAKYEVPYWNFNDVKKQYLDLKESDFYDSCHVVKSGSDKFTDIFVKIWKEYAQDKEVFAKYSYADWEEWEANHQDVYGIKLAVETEDGNVIAKLTTAASENTEVNYRYRLYNGEEMLEETPWISEESYCFEVEHEGNYYVRALARKTDSDEEYQVISAKEGIYVPVE